MTYSARCFSDPLYAVGYATARSPFGPWTKSDDGPILRRTDDVSGPGHNCITRSPDGSELMILYHVHRSLSGGHRRLLATDRLHVTSVAGGPPRLRTDGPSHTHRPMPAGAPAERLARAG